MRNRTRDLFASLCVCAWVPGAVAGTESPKAEPAAVKPTAAKPSDAKTIKAAPLDRTKKVPPQFDLRELKMLDVQGERHNLVADDARGAVFVFLSSECPISRQYVPELNRLAKTAGERKLAFYGVVSDPGVTRADARKFVDEFHVAFPVLFDASRELGVLFGPDHVPQAFLVDSRGSLQYRGRIDDLYADIDKRRTEPAQRDLLAAIVAVAEGKPVTTPRTEAIGCPFELRKEEPASSKVTYARDIAPIVFAHCAECHRPGEVAPFSLLTYQNAAKRAKGLVRATERRLMPPWRADVHYGDFLGERRLTEREIALVKAWADAERPKATPPTCRRNPSFPTDGGSARRTWSFRSPCDTPCRPTAPTSFSTS